MRRAIKLEARETNWVEAFYKTPPDPTFLTFTHDSTDASWNPRILINSGGSGANIEWSDDQGNTHTGEQPSWNYSGVPGDKVVTCELPSRTGLEVFEFATANWASKEIKGTFDTSAMTLDSNSDLDLDNNTAITNILFAAGTTLQMLSLSFADITGNFDLSNLTLGNLKVNVNTNLTAITFSGSNTLSVGGDFWLNNSGLTSLVSLANWDFWYNNVDIRLQNNGADAANVNRVLVEIDNMGATTLTGATLNIGGTNASPDSSSGGFDGTAAVTSLTGKGWTVTT